MRTVSIIFCFVVGLVLGLWPTEPKAQTTLLVPFPHVEGKIIQAQLEYGQGMLLSEVDANTGNSSNIGSWLPAITGVADMATSVISSTYYQPVIENNDPTRVMLRTNTATGQSSTIAMDKLADVNGLESNGTDLYAVRFKGAYNISIMQFNIVQKNLELEIVNMTEFETVLAGVTAYDKANNDFYFEASTNGLRQLVIVNTITGQYRWFTLHGWQFYHFDIKDGKVYGVTETAEIGSLLIPSKRYFVVFNPISGLIEEEIELEDEGVLQGAGGFDATGDYIWPGADEEGDKLYAVNSEGQLTEDLVITGNKALNAGQLVGFAITTEQVKIYLPILFK